VLIVKCDLVLMEAEKILALSYKLRKNFGEASSEVKEELFEFSNTIVDNFPMFSAARFFEIKRSIILSVLGTVTTFLVIMIQFRLSYD
jgi:hypothetical protein